MNDLDDYTHVFFQECDDLLDDLEGLLGALATGCADDETIHAAFRAVHSIKGGADAFGFRALVDFAHVYEAAMDAIRGGRIAAAPAVCETLVRAHDVLFDLVERAKAGDVDPLPAAASMAEELAAMTDLEPPPSRAAPQAAGGAASGDAETAETASDAAEAPPGEERAYVIRFAPGPEFHRSGHDALRVIQAAKDLGALDVTAEGEIPPLAEFDPAACPLSWRLALETDATPDAVEAFFAIYRETAEVEIEMVSGPSPEEAPPPEAAPAEAEDAAGASAGRPAPAKAPRTLRVDLDRVDRLVNMVGEIVISQAALAQTIAEAAEGGLDAAHAIDSMSRQTRELQESVMAIRAQPVKPVFSRMGRLVRDLAQQLGKEARVEVTGEHTEVDTTVIEELAEPLIHMVRNALDHGLERPDAREAAGKPREGVIAISAEHRGERIVISIGDDGAGVDRDRVLAKAVERGVVDAAAIPSPEEIDQLIFHPGLSTAENVTNVSGRGVGMDVVKKNIHALGGRVTLENRPGEGSTFRIILPLSLAVLDGMTIVVAGERFVIPLSSVVEALTLEDAAPERLPSGARVLRRRDAYLPLLSLRALLGLGGEDGGGQLVVVVDTETSGPIGLLVDELIGQRQVVLKSLEANYRSVEGVSGATILSDGRAALILDVPALPALASPPTAAAQEFAL